MLTKQFNFACIAGKSKLVHHGTSLQTILVWIIILYVCIPPCLNTQVGKTYKYLGIAHFFNLTCHMCSEYITLHIFCNSVVTVQGLRYWDS